MNDPERDPHPSVADPEDQPHMCIYCDALDDEEHGYHCALYCPTEPAEFYLNCANQALAMGWPAGADAYMALMKRRMRVA